MRKYIVRVNIDGVIHPIEVYGEGHIIKDKALTILNSGSVVAYFPEIVGFTIAPEPEKK